MLLYIATFYGVLMLIILLVFLTNNTHKKEEKSKKEIDQPKQLNLKEVAGESLHIHLNWLMMNGIIDNQEYNKLLIKSQPYIK